MRMANGQRFAQAPVDAAAALDDAVPPLPPTRGALTDGEGRVLEVLRAKQKPLRVPMDRAKVLGVVKRFAPQGVIDKLIDGLIGD